MPADIINCDSQQSSGEYNHVHQELNLVLTSVYYAGLVRLEWSLRAAFSLSNFL